MNIASEPRDSCKERKNLVSSCLHKIPRAVKHFWDVGKSKRRYIFHVGGEHNAQLSHHRTRLNFSPLNVYRLVSRDLIIEVVATPLLLTTACNPSMVQFGNLVTLNFNLYDRNNLSGRLYRSENFVSLLLI